MEWVDSLRGSVVGLDTAPLIYFIEENPNYLEIIYPFFEMLSRGEITVVTSTATLVEVLVVPLRYGNTKLANKYGKILFKTRGLKTIWLSDKIAEEAARLRAMHRLRALDAIQMATAIHTRASFFLTNDKSLPSLARLKVLALDELKANS